MANYTMLSSGSKGVANHLMLFFFNLNSDKVCGSNCFFIENILK
jgi:hypothetical protein